MSVCKFCNEEIDWKEDVISGKKYPVNPNNGTRHNCKKPQQPAQGTPTDNPGVVDVGGDAVEKAKAASEDLKVVEGQIVSIDHGIHKLSVKDKAGTVHDFVWSEVLNEKMAKLKQWWFTKITAEKSGEYWKVFSQDFFKRPDDWPAPAHGNAGGWKGQPRNEKLIVLQSSLKICTDLFQYCHVPDCQDYDAACELVYEKALEMTTKIMKDGAV